MELKKIIINDKELKYRNSDENVMIPIEYKEKDSYFRGAWVTSICNDFKASPNENEMKESLLKKTELLIQKTKERANSMKKWVSERYTPLIQNVLTRQKAEHFL